MARLHPKTAPGRWAWKEGQDFDLHREESQEDLQKYLNDSATLAEEEIVGAVVSFPIADGEALYLVVKDKPLTLQHIPYLDAWTIPPAH